MLVEIKKLLLCGANDFIVFEKVVKCGRYVFILFV